MTTTDQPITYTKRERGGYWASVPTTGYFNHIDYSVTKVDPWMRTSSYSTWEARRGHKVGWGATRDEAVRNAHQN